MQLAALASSKHNCFAFVPQGLHAIVFCPQFYRE